MAVTEELLDELELQAERVLKLEEMIRRQEALMEAEAAQRSAEDEAQSDRSAGVPGPSRRPRYDHPEDPRSMFASVPRRDLVFALRTVEAMHGTITRYTIAARCGVPALAVIASFVVLQSNVSTIVLSLSMVGMAFTVVKGDALMRRRAKEMHRNINEQAWAIQRELHRRASLEDRRSARGR